MRSAIATMVAAEAIVKMSCLRFISLSLRGARQIFAAASCCDHNVFKKFYSNRRRKLRIVHDAIDCRDAQPGIFVLAAEDGPRGAAREPKRLGLLIER